MTLAEAFIRQAESNRGLGSPFTARVLRRIAAQIAPGSPVMDRMLAFEGDLGPYGQSVPLRLLGGLHALVLSGAAPELTAVYPPNPAPDDASLDAALEHALIDHADTLLVALENPPQTNEVRRAAVMIAAGQWLAARYGLPFVLSELGASAGLNLMWDKFRLELACGDFGARTSPVILAPDWRGACPPEATVEVRERRGVDLSPLDPKDPQDALRLLSYLWADQPERLSRTRAAIAICDTEVDKGDAADWLEARLSTPHPGALHLVTHTIAWQYFPEPVQARCLAALEAAGEKATLERPLARLSMEADGEAHGAAISVTTWPHGETHALGRVDFHGRWLDWSPPETAQ